MVLGCGAWLLRVSLNGVIRGVGRSDNGGRMRCSYRFSGYSHITVGTAIGFRLNGVMRGGQISWTYTSYMRSGFRRGGRVANSDSSYDIGFL